jgi:hypothetical protein
VYVHADIFSAGDKGVPPLERLNEHSNLLHKGRSSFMSEELVKDIVDTVVPHAESAVFDGPEDNSAVLTVGGTTQFVHECDKIR